MKIKLIVFTITLTLCIGCTPSQTEYRRALSFFPTEFVDHFPDSWGNGYLSKLFFDKGDTIDELSNYLFKPNMVHTSKEFLFKKKFEEEAEAIKYRTTESYTSIDSSLLFVCIYSDRIDSTDKNKKYVSHNLSIENGTPVVLLENDRMYRGNTLGGLDESFVYYVLDAKPGKYLPDEYLNEPEISVMPPEWVHGFTKGAAISEKLKTIIYWIAVW